ncbi:hypothetical protein M747DRAFT_13960 [Aspergillus niger ATCC 13496]|uniref:Uncharacterized protein n=1 Tax=Aspergillus niger ATCC 13496 TaxID=1353008 RepID=A0A370BEJ8_ASPNG|nr:hypothetical protein M747DRAFT_13960 [Aspergillus niger ATCC 13496]
MSKSRKAFLVIIDSRTISVRNPVKGLSYANSVVYLLMTFVASVGHPGRPRRVDLDLQRPHKRLPSF